MFKDKEGQLRIVFHAHNNQEKIHPRHMYISSVRFTNEEMPVMQVHGDILKPVVVTIE